jgi:hypothetical protein
MIEKLKKLCGSMTYKDGYIFFLSPSEMEDYRNEWHSLHRIKEGLIWELDKKLRQNNFNSIPIIVFDDEVIDTPLFLKEDFIDWRRIK